MPSTTNIIKIALEKFMRLNQLQQILHRSISRARLEISDAVFSLKFRILRQDIEALIEIAVLVQIPIKDAAKFINLTNKQRKG